MAVLGLRRQRRDHARQDGQGEVDLSRLVQRFARGVGEAHGFGARQIDEGKLSDEHTAGVAGFGKGVVTKPTFADNLEYGVRARRLLIHVGHAHVTILLAYAEQLCGDYRNNSKRSESRRSCESPLLLTPRRRRAHSSLESAASAWRGPGDPSPPPCRSPRKKREE